MVLKSPMSAKMFERLGESLGPCELVRGEIVTLMAGGEIHSLITANVAIELGVWAKRTRKGRVLTGEAGLWTERDPDTVRGIDVAYFSFKRLPRGKESSGFAKVPPELAVEIIGEKQGWPELLEKAGEYLRMGVDRVWIIDPQASTLHVLRRDAAPKVFAESSIIRDVEILPGFRCRVRDFFV